MLYVCGVNGNSVSVVDTKDAVIEVATREDLFKLRTMGVLISGMTDDSIDICSGVWLEDEFFQWCVQSVNTEFKHKGFRDDESIFRFLVTTFNSMYKEVYDLKVTPVVSDSIHHFTADCIAEICRLHNIGCKVFREGSIIYSEVASKRVYENLGVVVYAYSTPEGKKAFRVMYR